MHIPIDVPACSSDRDGWPLAHVNMELTGLLAPQRAARGAVRVALADVSDKAWVDDVILVADELVGNAQRHTAFACTMSMTLDVYSWGAAVQVRDGEADINVLPSRPQLATGEAEDGRGLYLVSSLASSWSVQLMDSGKCVTAVFLADMREERR